MNLIIEESPRISLELMLVSSGIKQGDVIDWLIGLNKPLRNKIIKTINELELKTFKALNNKFNQEYYYNPKVTSPDLINLVKSISQMSDSQARITEGLFYGYPLCCILAMESGNYHKTPMPMTEHYWCKPDCQASIKLQAEYARIIPQEYQKYSLINLK